MRDLGARRVVHGADHVDPGGSIVKSGLLLADAIIAAIGSAEQVEVDLQSVKGASSSYFNVLLQRLQEAGHLGAFDGRITLRFGSEIQDQVFRKSLTALRRKLEKAEKDKLRRATRTATQTPVSEPKSRKSVFRGLFRPRGNA